MSNTIIKGMKVDNVEVKEDKVTLTKNTVETVFSGTLKDAEEEVTNAEIALETIQSQISSLQQEAARRGEDLAIAIDICEQVKKSLQV